MKNFKHDPRKILVPVILLLIIGGGLFYWFRGKDQGLALRGEVEGTIYSQIADVAGKIVEMGVELGSPVKAGDLIARLDNTDQRYALEQLQIVLEKRQLMLRTLLKGARQEELAKARSDVSIAEANYHSAEASYKQAQDDIEPLARLLEAGGLAQNELDRARLRQTIAAEALEAAAGQVRKAREQLSLLQKGSDAETIALAEEDIMDAESRIRQMEETLRKYEIRANCDGMVIGINFNLGSMVNAGYNVADISADREKYVVCYVPRESSMQISYGQLLTIRSGGKEYQGELRYIDVKSQYTPKDMQTTATKNKVSVKIKILLPPDTIFKPGNRVEVII